MGDILKFLFIVGIIVIGIVRQVKKEKETNKKTFIPPTIPNKDKVENTRIPTSKKKKEPEKRVPQSFLTVTESSTSSPYRPATSTLSTPPPSDDTAQITENESDFSIHSIEEARKAIIWSEILRRKY